MSMSIYVLSMSLLPFTSFILMRCPNWPYLTYTSHIFLSGIILGFHPKSCKNADRKVQGDVSKARIESKANPILGDLWKFRNQMVHSGVMLSVRCWTPKGTCVSAKVLHRLYVFLFKPSFFNESPLKIFAKTVRLIGHKHDYSSQWELTKDRRFGSSCDLHSWRSK